MKDLINKTELFNQRNPDRKVTLIIDKHNDDYWFERNGERLSLIAEHKIIMTGEDE